MKEVYDFIINALPWVAIGLFVACSIVSEKAKKDGKKLTARFKAMCWSPAVCFLFVAVMEMSSGNRSSGTTWLILCVFNAMINFANTQKSKNGAEKPKRKTAMNKRSIISVLLFVLSAAFAVWFIFQLVIDYTVLYPHGSAPFYVYVLARLLDRLLPAAILLAAGIALKRKK